MFVEHFVGVAFSLQNIYLFGLINHALFLETESEDKIVGG